MAEQTGGNLESELAPVYRFWTDKAFILLFILAVLINLALLGAILNVFPQLPERLPILFNAQGQADLVANKVYLYRLPLGVTLLTIFNGTVTAFLVKDSAFAARMLMLATCWIGLLLMAGLWFIIR
jgi:uncharacterized membrane protein